MYGAIFGSMGSTAGAAMYSYIISLGTHHVKNRVHGSRVNHSSNDPAQILNASHIRHGTQAHEYNDSHRFHDFFSRVNWLPTIVVTLWLFVAVIGGITLFEHFTNKPLADTLTGHKGTGTSIGRAFTVPEPAYTPISVTRHHHSVSPSTSPSPSATVPISPTPTITPTAPSSSPSPSPSLSRAPSPRVTVLPSQSATATVPTAFPTPSGLNASS